MENPARSLSSRYVIEDSIPRVTSDGQPHEVLTMVAVGSGFIAAFIVLFILISFIGNRNRTNENEEEESGICSKDSEPVIIPIFNSTNRRDDVSEESRPKLLSISSISENVPNLEGEINLAYLGCPCDSQPSTSAGPSCTCTSRC